VFVCKIVISSIIQIKVTNRVKWDDITDLFYYEPGGTSTKNLIHWIQVYEKKELMQFDYGKKNFEFYGKENPPKYDVDNFRKWKIKSFITLSNDDPFSTEKDINFFMDAIQNKTDYITVKKLYNYNHLDYLWSSDAKQDLYIDILKFLSN
jgi:lysosomal acid lipase/cholesteryl ester hydrolase